jgi:DNA processing protein
VTLLPNSIDACGDCLRRTELIGWLSGRIEIEWRLRRGRPQILALADAELLTWGADDAVRAAYASYSPDFSLDRLTAAGLSAVCRCSPLYPPGLGDLPDPPAVLHYAGDSELLVGDGVAIVGARNASSYGLDVAGALGRGVAAAGVTVVSGMAMGVDAAAHHGALAGGPGRTLCVLATGVDRPYPARFHALHREIVKQGCVVSEMAPGTEPRRWAFPARNRIIAALSRGTVVVEGGERSGSLITADFAAELGRFVGAVPGPATSPRSAGPHALLKAGAEVVRNTEDVLDLLGADTLGSRDPTPVVIGSGERTLRPLPEPIPPPPDLSPELRDLLDRVAQGAGSLAELVTDPANGFAISRDLGELELRGLIRRVAGGRYIRAAR